MKKIILFLTTTFFAGLFLSSCVGPNPFSQEMTTATPIDLTKYVGKWYEAKRLDNWFEKGLINTTATYTSTGTNDKGYPVIKVVNAGVVEATGEASEAIGQAIIPDVENAPGRLEVAFDPAKIFYADYNVILLGPEVDGYYSYAVIAGGSTKYLWYLVRDMADFDTDLETTMDEAAEAYGFDTSAMISPQK